MTSRPAEIEQWTNAVLVHPVSQRLADRFIALGMTANMVSVLGLLSMACAASAFYAVPGMPGAAAGVVFMWLSHVLDGADGKVARAMKTASPHGEIVDGVCDYGGYALIYLALGLLAAREIGAWPAVAITLAAGVCHVLQANFYETSRRIYCNRIYGTPWIGTLSSAEIAAMAASGALTGRAFAALTRLFLALSRRLYRDDGAPAPRPGDAGFAAFREASARKVKLWALCSQNVKTIAVSLAMLAGCPLCYFLFVLVVVNGAIALAFIAGRRAWRIIRRA